MKPDVIPFPVVDFANLAILLDVDGTILDVAPTPQSVRVPQGLPRTLDALWRRTGGALAFVSGRPLNDLDRIFSPLRLPTIGGHGADLRVAGDAEPRRLSSMDSEVKRQFAAIADIAPG